MRYPDLIALIALSYGALYLWLIVYAYAKKDSRK